MSRSCGWVKSGQEGLRGPGSVCRGLLQQEYIVESMSCDDATWLLMAWRFPGCNLVPEQPSSKDVAGANGLTGSSGWLHGILSSTAEW